MNRFTQDGAGCLQFTVYGQPVPQGSLRSLGRGRPSIHSNAQNLLPWRETVKVHARQAMAGRGRFERGTPLVMTCVFSLRRPKNAKQNSLPTSRPDFDKLVRAIADALTDVVYDDDSQVVFAHTGKVWAGDDIGLDEPGVVIQIREITPTTGDVA